MTAKRFRVNDLVKYNYSEIGEYIDENHTDRPLRNDELVELLNELHEEVESLKEEIARQKYSKRMMRDNIKGYERAIKRLRKSYEEFDEMRLERIRFLEKKLKKNGLSIYVNDCGDLE